VEGKREPRSILIKKGGIAHTNTGGKGKKKFAGGKAAGCLGFTKGLGNQAAGKTPTNGGFRQMLTPIRVHSQKKKCVVIR